MNEISEPVPSTIKRDALVVPYSAQRYYYLPPIPIGPFTEQPMNIDLVEVELRTIAGRLDDWRVIVWRWGIAPDGREVATEWIYR